MRIPKKENIHTTNIEDAFSLYYTPGINYLYLKRFELVLKLMGYHYNRLLDVGYGCGIFLPELFKRCKRLYGCDIHPNKAITEAMMKKEGINAELSRQSVFKMDYPDGFFDCTVCLSVLEHVVDVNKAALEIARVTSKGGDIIIGYPVKSGILDICYNLMNKYIIRSGMTIEQIHVSSHTKIRAILEKRFLIKKVTIIPGLYYIMKCGKR